jgi:hypothetical protein
MIIFFVLAKFIFTASSCCSCCSCIFSASIWILILIISPYIEHLRSLLCVALAHRAVALFSHRLSRSLSSVHTKCPSQRPGVVLSSRTRSLHEPRYLSHLSCSSSKFF